MTFSVLSVVGARPQFVKAAAVTRALRDISAREVLVHTGQHHDQNMSQIFFDELEIPKPKYNLNVAGGRHGAMTGRMLPALEDVVLRERPDVVMVYGDTNSTLAGALAAAKLLVPVAHVEAGLRSFDRNMPEEINRVLTDHVAQLHLCPTFASVANLRREGIENGVVHVGDVMYDAALHAAARAELRSQVLADLNLGAAPYAVATVHRAENTDAAERLAAVVERLRVESLHQPVVLPLHPRTRAACERFNVSLEGLLVVPPLGYLDMTMLVKRASLVLTDSGGLQKEAYFHRVPCITLRDSMEGVEMLGAGWNQLGGVTRPVATGRREIPEYGNGRAAEEVVTALAAFTAGLGA